MVTIEQKLSMFSKLLHRSMNEKFTEEMENLKKEYEVKLQNSKDSVDREAEGLISNARKKAETEKTELVSRIKVDTKKEYMSVKEKYFNILMDHLKDEIEIFIQSDKYVDYMFTLVKKLEETGQLSDSLVISMTGRDIERYAENIKQLLKEKYGSLTFKTANDRIIGGFIAEYPDIDIRMNFSIETLLEDNRAYIMHTLFMALEAGEAYGI